MNRTVIACLLATAGLAVARPSSAQGQPDRVAAAKQAAAMNQQALRAYSWVEKTEILVKGEVKNTKLEACQYGPDGKVQKTPLGDPPEQAPPERGGRRGGRVKERVVAKKTGEMKAEMQAASALVHQYLPPSADRIQAAAAAGKLSLHPGEGTVALRMADYLKPGDNFVLTLDPAARAMKRIDIDTWLDEPGTRVTVAVGMQSLPDGTDYAGTVSLAIPSSKIEVRIVNSNYQKLVP